MTSSHVEKIALRCATICREKGLVETSQCPHIAEYVSKAIFMLYTSDTIITDILDTVILSLHVDEALRPVFNNEKLHLKLGYTKDGSVCEEDVTLVIMFENGGLIKTHLPRSNGEAAFGQELWDRLNSRKMSIRIKQVPVEKVCDVCAASTHLKKCTGCGVAYYCSAACQKIGWKNHKMLCRTSITHGPGDILNIERASTSMIVQRLRESKVVQSVCTAHAKASIALSSSSLEMSNVQVETSQDIDLYIFELAKKMAEAAVGMGRQLHVKDSKTLEILQKHPECFAYTF